MICPGKLPGTDHQELKKHGKFSKWVVDFFVVVVVFGIFNPKKKKNKILEQMRDNSKKASSCL